jgi:hypothetical protein
MSRGQRTKGTGEMPPSKALLENLGPRSKRCSAPLLVLCRTLKLRTSSVPSCRGEEWLLATSTPARYDVTALKPASHSIPKFCIALGVLARRPQAAGGPPSSSVPLIWSMSMDFWRRPLARIASLSLQRTGRKDHSSSQTMPRRRKQRRHTGAAVCTVHAAAALLRSNVASSSPPVTNPVHASRIDLAAGKAGHAESSKNFYLHPVYQYR